MSGASVDPVPGGNSNDYAYPQDPINMSDLNGMWGWDDVCDVVKSVAKVVTPVIKVVTAVATVASFIPGPIGMIASGIAVAGNLAQGNYAGAAMAALGLLGGGLVAAAVARTASMAGKVVRSVVGAQAEMKGIGVTSKLFGRGSAMSSGKLRLGWSNASNPVGKGQNAAWRVGWKKSHPYTLHSNRYWQNPHARR